MTPASSHEHDLVVVGAGPAGAAAALGALKEDPSLRVLLLDRADFPRDKCCGDGIAPHVLDVLAPLGAADVVAGWRSLQHLTLSRGDRDVAGRMRRDVHVIPREVFDARLVERAVERGAELRRHRVSKVTTGRAGVQVDDLGAPVVVGADGVHSAVRGGIGLAPTGRRALALRGYAPTPPGRRGLQVIRYGERRQPSYAWSFDRGDGLSNVGYGELADDPGDKPSRALLLEQLEELLPGSTAGGTAWRGHHLPLSGRRWTHPDGRVLLAGDAAGLVNPMTGEGIYYAVATGALAGRAAARALRAGEPYAAGAAYARDVRTLLARHLGHTWAASHLSRHPAVVDAGIRAASRDQAVFDDLVEIGLGGGTITPRLGRGLVAGLVTDVAGRRTDRRADRRAATPT
ncbi:Putative oxidoreductase [Nocardioides dokdonensis FR1436]|uniref:Putative oxidoreductase n=1 Tax=Nocardioides dokdonensis FR1436 TaxID=1300347 RepID=A0A1A9GRA8_9ACTN|nr:geranylgeranyl reductase family protein [Nocardioides dokdonensis]ANH40180.1 Putative oxidoreductase [Nocardioides dokdonensis FR1436]